MTRARDLGDFIADGAAPELVVDTTTLVVDSTNNRVGVGTASPSQALDVNGTGNFTAISLGGTAITATATELNYVDGVSSGIQTQLDAKAPLASPTFTGDVTIPDKIVHTGDTNTAIRFPAADTVAFETAGSERFRFGSAGQLGVAGANYGTSGQVLQSGGASGAASWADAASSAVSFTAQADGAIDANRVAA